jgi:hypothetical protein
VPGCLPASYPTDRYSKNAETIRVCSKNAAWGLPKGLGTGRRIPWRFGGFTSTKSEPTNRKKGLYTPSSEELSDFYIQQQEIKLLVNIQENLPFKTYI